MKKVVAGGFLSLFGTIWTLAIIVHVENNLVSSWDPTLGRFFATTAEKGMVFPLMLSAGVALAGILMMLIECFKKDS